MYKLSIEQKDGIVYVYEGSSLQTSYNFTHKDKMSAIALANVVAELLYEVGNCPNVYFTSLRDCNDTHCYMGTYFETI